MIRRIVVLIATLVAFAAPNLASAQTDARQAQLAQWLSVIRTINYAVDAAGTESQDLDRLYHSAQTILGAANALRESLGPEIAAVEARLQSLVPIAGDTGPEPPLIAQVRAEQRALLTGLTGIDQQADVIALRAAELVAEIDDRRTQRFNRQTFAHGPSILSPALWAEIGRSAPNMLVRVGETAASWLDLVSSRAGSSVTFLLIAALAFVVAVLLVGRLVLVWAYRRSDSQPPVLPERIVAATWVLIVYAGTALLIVLGLRAMFTVDGLLPGGAADLVGAISRAVVEFTAIVALSHGLFSPTRPEWRVLRVPDATARLAHRLIFVAALLVAAITLVTRLAALAVSPLGPPAASAALAVIAALIVIVAARRITAVTIAASDETVADHHSRWSWLLPIAMLTSTAAIVAALVGYLAFSAFLMQQLAWVWLVVGTTVIAIGLLDQALAAVFSSEGLMGRSMTAGFMLSHRLLDQLGIVMAGVARLLILIFAAISIAQPWGVDSSDLTTQLEGVLSGFQIGSIRISIQAIAAGIALFIVVVALARIFQSWLGNRLLPATSLDIGLKNSIVTSVNYVGVILAAVVAASYAGFNLANIAIVAGALSVGIGFGLQSIVNNFVSGLILLIERPIRAGDWIEVGNEHGTVKRISVRATEIETPNAASVIIPNSNLISGVVKNINLHGKTGRIAIGVGVAYGSDPEQVRDILLECAHEQDMVQPFPEPEVAFLDFGDSSLDFELRCHVSDISKQVKVLSDLRFSILKRLKAAGIEIPFPQHDLNLRDWPKIEEAVVGFLKKLAGEPPEIPKKSNEPSP